MRGFSATRQNQALPARCAPDVGPSASERAAAHAPGTSSLVRSTRVSADFLPGMLTSRIACCRFACSSALRTARALPPALSFACGRGRRGGRRGGGLSAAPRRGGGRGAEAAARRAPAAARPRRRSGSADLARTQRGHGRRRGGMGTHRGDFGEEAHQLGARAVGEHELLLREHLVRDRHQLRGAVIMERNSRRKARGETRVHLHQLFHLVRVAGEDGDDVVAVVLEQLNECVERLPAERVLAVLDERVRLRGGRGGGGGARRSAGRRLAIRAHSCTCAAHSAWASAQGGKAGAAAAGRSRRARAPRRRSARLRARSPPRRAS